MEKEDLNPDLWHICAGEGVRIPPINSKAYYFIKGHAEQAAGHVDLRVLPPFLRQVACRVLSIKYLADPGTDEVYAKIGLVPLRRGECHFDDEKAYVNEEKKKLDWFGKTLIESDININDGGEFCVPSECAESIFPRADEGREILAKDVHGKVWGLTHHVYDAASKHLLSMTTGSGWSGFVNEKKLVSGDCIVFLRDGNGDIRVGIRKKEKGSPTDRLNYVTPSAVEGRGTLRIASVIEAANYAANGHPFVVDYYPRAGTPEFVVRCSTVADAMRKSNWTDDTFNLDSWSSYSWRSLEGVNPWLVESTLDVPLVRHITYHVYDVPRPPKATPRIVMDYDREEQEEDGAGPS